jgi:hypothetical protein
VSRDLAPGKARSGTKSEVSTKGVKNEQQPA